MTSDHPTKSQNCCIEAAVDALSGLVRLSVAYRESRLTEESIRSKLPIAVQFAQSEDHLVEDADLNQIFGHVRMQFTVLQPEANRLDGGAVDHIPWLAQKKAQILTKNGFWDNYRRLLENRIPNTPRNRLDEVTDTILDGLENPIRPGQWDRRGLVMGSVQSGKTNNYIGLLCKAADAGYKLIIVLAGIHNDLRGQTQFRIDEAMVGRDTRLGVQSRKKVGVGLEHSNKAVISLTSATDEGDFSKLVAANVGFDFANIEQPTVLVVKKNYNVLGNLYDWIQVNAQKPSGYDRVPDVPVLVVDDEADYASIDVNKKDAEESDPSAINGQIRRILHTFDQSAYVGYTATPFANILIDRDTTSKEFGDDLFPRDFLIALEPPDNYVGPEQVFGITGQSETDELQGIPLVNDVTDAVDWIPARHRANLQVQEDLFPESLRRAIASFVLSCAARRHRGQKQEHKSMLIHVTPFVEPQRQVREQVVNHLYDLKNLLLYDHGQAKAERKVLEEIWITDFVPAIEQLATQRSEDVAPHDFGKILSEVEDAVSSIEVRLLNGSSVDGLDYHEHPDGLSVIVIGGAKLSRGLTLEGLSVSYYLRATRMYDTLMQMGRWFGYRPGYLDLCRLYTTPTISTYYRNITQAVRELLDEFAIMARQKAKPTEFGLRVRHSSGMFVTGASKMRSGRRMRLSFSGVRPESTSFEAAPVRRRQALQNVEVLIDRLADPDGRTSSGDHYWNDISFSEIVAFFNGLSKDKLFLNARSAMPEYLAQFILTRAEKGLLVRWHVLLKSNSDKEATIFPIAGLPIGLSNRAHAGSKNLDFYSPKSVIGSQDEAFGLSTEQRKRAASLAGSSTNETTYGAYYRQVRDPATALLVLYLLSGSGIKNGDHIEDGPPFASYAVSFPRIKGDNGVEYIVNAVYQE